MRNMAELINPSMSLWIINVRTVVGFSIPPHGGFDPPLSDQKRNVAKLKFLPAAEPDQKRHVTLLKNGVGSREWRVGLPRVTLGAPIVAAMLRQ